MNNEQYSTQIFKDLTSLRKQPDTWAKKFTTIAKALKRGKRVKEGDELEQFASTLANKTIMSGVKLSEGLCNAAREELKRLVSAPDYYVKQNQGELLARCHKYSEKVEGAYEITDHGLLDHFLTRCMVSDNDPDRINRQIIFNPSYKFVGIASCEINDDADATVVIFAKDVRENVDYGEDELLKQAFDLFDIYDTGKLREEELKAAFEALGFDKKHKSVFQVMVNMDINPLVKKNDGCDWETFRNTCHALVGDLETNVGLKKLFDLFVDDSQQNVIAHNTMRRVRDELKDELNNDQLLEVIKRAAENGNDIGYEEFCRIMREANNLSGSELKQL